MAVSDCVVAMDLLGTASNAPVLPKSLYGREAETCNAGHSRLLRPPRPGGSAEGVRSENVSGLVAACMTGAGEVGVIASLGMHSRCP